MSILESIGVPRYAAIDQAATGDLVAAVAGKRIRLLGLVLVADAAVTATIRSDAAAISGPMALGANTPLESHAGWGLVETTAGESLNLLLGSAVQVSGTLTYQVLD